MRNPFTALHKRLRGERGTTLVEVLITAGLLPMTLGVAYLVMAHSFTNWKITEHKSEALGSARYLVDRLGRDLRQAERPFISVDTVNFNFIIFKANINKKPGSEIISYNLKPFASTGEQLVRSVYDPNMTDPLNPVYPNSPTSEEVMAKIILNNLTSPKISLFSFKKANNVTFVSGDDIRLIRSVSIDIKVTSAENKANIYSDGFAQSVRINNTVRLRNF